MGLVMGIGLTNNGLGPSPIVEWVLGLWCNRVQSDKYWVLGYGIQTGMGSPSG